MRILPLSVSYSYTVGNRVQSLSYGNGVKTTYVYADDKINRLTEAVYNGSKERYAYDKQGNMVSEENEKEARSYHYNAFNKQTALCVDNKEIQSHFYDGENLRYETEENGKRIRFLFDRGELAAEKQESRWKGYSRGHQLLAAQAEQEEWDYFLSDEMGSTVFLLDRKQNIKKATAMMHLVV